MVQTEDQYILIFDALAAFFENCVDDIAQYYEPFDACWAALRSPHKDALDAFIKRNNYFA